MPLKRSSDGGRDGGLFPPPPPEMVIITVIKADKFSIYMTLSRPKARPRPVAARGDGF